jgi:hypothetical protein
LKYEIIGLVILWFVVLYLRGKFYERLRDRDYNVSWRKRKWGDAVEVSFFIVDGY